MVIAIRNTTDLWRNNLPDPSPEGHKYDRGHTAILGANEFTGATRLAAEACSRIGSGLVSVLSETQAQVYRTTLPPDIMVSERGLDALNRVNTILAGPGGCADDQAKVLLGSDPSTSLVVDADAIRLWPQLSGRAFVMTPHESEFTRYFDHLDGDMLEQVGKASKKTGAVIVLKRPETVIAAPDGRIIVNHSASRYLAKGGTGDVLAGMIAGFVAQGMKEIPAACAAVWMHSVASERIGPGLLPQDIIPLIRPLLRELLS
ncbi:MAG: NAD(P)H-hydrate dehydratase [Pseudomonadota bacterium]